MSTFFGDRLAVDDLPERLDAVEPDVERELRDTRVLAAGLDLRDLLRLGVVADHHEARRVDMRVRQRLVGAERRRATRRVERLQVGVRRQDRLRLVEALGLVAVGLELADDLELALQRARAPSASR